MFPEDPNNPYVTALALLRKQQAGQAVRPVNETELDEEVEMQARSTSAASDQDQTAAVASQAKKPRSNSAESSENAALKEQLKSLTEKVSALSSSQDRVTRENYESERRRLQAQLAAAEQREKEREQEARLKEQKEREQKAIDDYKRFQADRIVSFNNYMKLGARSEQLQQYNTALEEYTRALKNVKEAQLARTARIRTSFFDNLNETDYKEEEYQARLAVIGCQCNAQHYAEAYTAIKALDISIRYPSYHHAATLKARITQQIVKQANICLAETRTLDIVHSSTARDQAKYKSQSAKSLFNMVDEPLPIELRSLLKKIHWFDWRDSVHARIATLKQSNTNLVDYGPINAEINDVISTMNDAFEFLDKQERDDLQDLQALQVTLTKELAAQRERERLERERFEDIMNQKVIRQLMFSAYEFLQTGKIEDAYNEIKLAQDKTRRFHNPQNILQYVPALGEANLLYTPAEYFDVSLVMLDSQVAQFKQRRATEVAAIGETVKNDALIRYARERSIKEGKLFNATLFEKDAAKLEKSLTKLLSDNWYKFDQRPAVIASTKLTLTSMIQFSLKDIGFLNSYWHWSYSNVELDPAVFETITQTISNQKVIKPDVIVSLPIFAQVTTPPEANVAPDADSANVPQAEVVGQRLYPTLV